MNQNRILLGISGDIIKSLPSVYLKFVKKSVSHVNSSCGFPSLINIDELRYDISNNVVYATSNSSDQPVQTCSLIRAFANRLKIL